jgi:putative membrane protein
MQDMMQQMMKQKQSAEGTTEGMTMMMDGMGMMMWGIRLFVVIVVAAVKRLWGPKMRFLISDRENALEILKKRYAKGEIGKEEYERIKKDIE